MKNLLFMIALLLGAAPVTDHTNSQTKQKYLASETGSASFSKVELKVRNAAVRVITGGGHGSGSYLVHKGFHFILTAQHVTDGPLGKHYMISKDEEMRMAILVYSSPADDIAVLFLEDPFKFAEPMKYKTTKEISKISTKTTYSGFPSSHKLMTIRGRVAGYADKLGSSKQIILHTYGWFGCSGSVIYNKFGEVIGVLWGVDVEYYPGVAIVEDMIWVVPIQQLDIQKPINLICKHNKMKFC